MIKFIITLAFISISVFSAPADQFFDYKIHYSYEYSPKSDRSKQLALDNLELNYPIHEFSFGSSYELKRWLQPALFLNIHYGGCSDNKVTKSYTNIDLQSIRYGFHIVPGIILRLVKIKKVSLHVNLLLKYGWAYEIINGFGNHGSNRVNLINYSISGYNKGLILKAVIEYRFNERQAISFSASRNRSYFQNSQSYDDRFMLPYMNPFDIGDGTYFGLSYTINVSDNQKTSIPK